MDTQSVRQRIDQCIGRLERGELTAEHLQAFANELDNGKPRRQDLLYMQTLFSTVTSKVNGMAMVEDGQVKTLPDDPEQWPYQSVLEAINDGWRIISFPNQALMMESSQTYGMGCEFILERIR